MKIGQMASFIDIDFLPPEYREIYQEQLAKLRAHAPAMPWEKVREVLAEEYERPPPEQLFASIEHEAFAAASIGQVHRATLHDGSPVAVKVQYPGIAEALESDMANAGILVRLAKALAPGLDAKAVAGELRERVLEELDYEYEAQNQRAFARAYDGHPFIYVPKVHSRLSRRRVLVSEFVEGRDFEEVKQLAQDERDIFGEIVFRFCFGSIYHLQHFNADTHPGNYLLMDDGRVAFLDFGMTKRLTPEPDPARAAGGRRRRHATTPRPCARRCTSSASSRDPDRIDAERLMEHVKLVGGWYMEDEPVRDHAEAGDEDDRGHLRPALGLLRPGPPGEPARRRADGAADGDGPAGGAGAAAGDRQLAPDHARVGLRRPALDGAGRGGVALLRAPRDQRRRPACRAGSSSPPASALALARPSVSPGSFFACRRLLGAARLAVLAGVLRRSARAPRPRPASRPLRTGAGRC